MGFFSRLIRSNASNSDASVKNSREVNSVELNSELQCNGPKHLGRPDTLETDEENTESQDAKLRQLESPNGDNVCSDSEDDR